ncbi:unnamed protein product [Pylaiella littoralis]
MAFRNSIESPLGLTIRATPSTHLSGRKASNKPPGALKLREDVKLFASACISSACPDAHCCCVVLNPCRLLETPQHAWACSVNCAIYTACSLGKGVCGRTGGVK